MLSAIYCKHSNTQPTDTMSSIKITTTGNTTRCVTPYHPEFPAAARSLGGKWAAPAWTFDARDEQRVRDLCLDLFGTDGTPCELVTLRCVADSSLWDSAGSGTERCYLAGRMIAKVFSKNDVRAKLGDGVVITSGGFHGDGSHKNPYVGNKPDTVFELRDIPRAMADKIREDHPDLVEIIASPLSPAPEAVRVSPEHQALLDRRAALLAELSDLDAKIKSVPTLAVNVTHGIADELRDAD